jgi:2,5-dihydroxypyridine 5,6-dioxygenase
VVSALGQSAMVVDCTVEGLLHAPELPQILGAGARVLMISNEHPEALERLVPTADLEAKVKAGIRRLRAAKQMHVTSPSGTDLHVSLEGAAVGGGWGYTTRPGTITHWPGGLCLCFPARGSVAGRLVMAPGDVNLTFKRYLESPIELTIRDDYVVDIAGHGLDAELMRSYFAAWGDRDAYAVSHAGWGMNPGARWDAMAMYDKNDFNGTELRAFAGNFLYSTGANEVAGRRNAGPLRPPAAPLHGEPRRRGRRRRRRAPGRPRVSALPALAPLVPIPESAPLACGCGSPFKSAGTGDRLLVFLRACTRP